MYNWLFDILHDTQETRYPLAAAFRSANRTRKVCGLKALLEYQYTNLRLAYNAFIRLLDLNFPELFQCPERGPDVDCVIMDGIIMGCRQAVMPPAGDRSLDNLAQIPECSISDRVLIANVNSRRKLAKYASIVKGKYGICERLSAADFIDLCTSLKDYPSIRQLVQEAGPKCPVSHQKFLGELSRGSPTCAIYIIFI